MMLGLSLLHKAGQRVLGGLNALIKTLTGRATYSENTADSNTVVEAIDTAGVLDDATILLTPTAYSDARVHSVKTYTGSELVTNGDFSNWTGDNPDNYLVLNENANNYVTESSGQLRMVSDNSATIAIRPQPTTMLTVGSTYRVSVDLTFTTGTLDISGVSFNTSGTKVFYLTAATTYLQLAKASALDVLIDNLSIIDVSSDFDFDRASSATRINSSSLVQDIVSDLARINYDGSGANGHILLEPTSTNLLTYSQEFLHVSGYWNKSNTVIESTAITSPDGNSNTYKLFANTSTTGHFTDYDGYTGAAIGQTYTFSLFVKSAGSDYIQIAASSGFPSVYQNFNLSTGALASGNISSATIEAYPNDWYRISVTETTTATSRRFLIVPALTDMLRNATFTGTVEEDGVYIFGAQLEQISYPTSYIPTSGSSVTRAAETLTGSGNSTLINTTQGTIYLESKLGGTTGTKLFSIGGGTNNADPAVTMGYTGQNMYMDIIDSGSLISTPSDRIITGINVNSYNKMAIKYTTTNITVYLNGVQKHTETIDFTPATNVLKALYAGYGVGSKFEGQIKALTVFDRALTNQELIDLTT